VRPRRDGVTVAICCHNSARLLPATLRSLERQVSDVPWEVLVVDNGSTDGTSDVAHAGWSHSSIPLRVVGEPRLGVANARKRAFQEADYEIVTFLDDDNHAAPDWVQRVWEIMTSHPGVGACGGRNIPDCEIDPPQWFSRHFDSYAVGNVQTEAGDVTDTVGFLWGAGLTIRRSAWTELLERGFRFTLDGRLGDSLGSGEDRELCMGLRICGWHLWYDPALVLHHYLPAERLSWRHLRALQHGFGASTVALDTYGPRKTGPIRSRWWWQVLSSQVKVGVRAALAAPALIGRREGSLRLLRFDASRGRLAGLLSARSTYRDNLINARYLLRVAPLADGDILDEADLRRPAVEEM
jgi:glycosyltransferase involved in cell wall biosynthesis